MLPRIDPTSGVPLYIQIVDQFKRAIASGVMRDGDPLPSLRELAKDLRINPLTIKKAYEQLEAEGIVLTQHGRGTYVSSNGRALPRSARRDLLHDHVEKLIVEAQHLGLEFGEVRELVEKGIQAWERARAKENLR